MAGSPHRRQYPGHFQPDIAKRMAQRRIILSTKPAGGPQPYNNTQTGLRNVIALVIVGTPGPLIIMVMPVFVGAVTDSLGLDDRQTGLLAAADMAGMTCAAICAFYLVKHLNWRLIAGAGACGLAIANLLATTAADFDTLCVYRVICGISTGLVHSVVVAGMSDTSQPERFLALALASQALIGACGLVVFPALMESFGFQVVFLVSAISVALVIPFVTGIPPGLQHHRKRQQVTELTTGIGRPVCVLIGILLFDTALFEVWIYIERIGRAADITAQFIGNWLGAATILGFVGLLLAGWLGNRCGRKLPLGVACCSFLLALFMLGNEPGGVQFAFSAILIQLFAFNFAVPFLVASVARVDPSGRFVVLTTVVLGLAGLLGGWLGGLLVSSGSYPLMLLGSGVFMLLSFLLVVLVSPNDVVTGDIYQGASED